MRRRNDGYAYARRIHRFLGLFLGIQFLFWTLGGIYFSFSNMDDVHGDTNRNPTPKIAADINFISPSLIIDSLKKGQQLDSVVSVRLIDVLARPCYQIQYITAGARSKKSLEKISTQLAYAETGEFRPAISKEEAIVMASLAFKEKAKVIETVYIVDANGHDEYRGNPLPAFMVKLDHGTKTNVYVATELGEVTKFRNEKWRVFDFLWMLHTMDFEGRDNFGNILLRIFSILGLMTVLSGFVLFYYKRKWRNKYS